MGVGEMTKIVNDCSNCEGSLYCISKPSKKDYKFPEEENQYLMDLECGIWKCHTAVIKLLTENKELKYALSSSMTEQEFLENEIKNFKSGAEYKALADMVDSLQKENAELKKDKEWLDNTNNEQTEVILKLNEQIEKMKCCHNCKNFIDKSYCITPCEEHSEWELAE